MITAAVVFSGIIGTIAMTLFVEAAALFLKKPFHVVSILSYMLRFGKSLKSQAGRIVYSIALVLHHTIGILFTFAFKFLIEANILRVEWSHALLFGMLAGTIGIAGWRLFFAVHPAPPKISIFQYLTVIWLGHLVFSAAQFFSLITITSFMSKA